jgi:hypothetical protein
MSSLRKTLLCVAACVTLFSSPCDAEALDDSIDDVWEDMLRDREPIQSNKPLAVLRTFAFQAANSKDIPTVEE